MALNKGNAMREIIIKINDKDQTLIKFLEKYLEGAPKSAIQKFIRKKRIKVNGKRAESSYKLALGDRVNIYIYDEVIEEWKKKAEKSKVHSKLKLDIAFENDDIVVIDKPINTLSHPASEDDYGKTVVDFLISYLIDKGDYVPRLEHSFIPAIVNRLDRNTMGLIIGAKNRESLVKLNEIIDSNKVEKAYLAVVEGSFVGERSITNYLEKDERNVVHVSNSDRGKIAKTDIKAIRTGERYSLIELRITTGRTHQIRATLSDLGYPIVGDRKYNKNKIKGINHQLLAAYKLNFSDDIEIKSLRKLSVTSELSKSIYDIFNKLQEKK